MDYRHCTRWILCLIHDSFLNVPPYFRQILTVERIHTIHSTTSLLTNHSITKYLPIKSHQITIQYRTYLFNILILAEPNKESTSPTSSQSVATNNPSSSARVVVTTDPGDNPWDLGWRRNWTQVMGDKVWDWFLPIRPSQGDGVRFPYNESLVKKLRDRARAIVVGQSRDEHDMESQTFVAPSAPV